MNEGTRQESALDGNSVRRDHYPTAERTVGSERCDPARLKEETAGGQVCPTDDDERGSGRITADLDMQSILRTLPEGAGEVQDIYLLSPLQEGMLFHRLLNEKNDTYILATLFELSSSAQIELLI